MNTVAKEPRRTQETEREAKTIQMPRDRVPNRMVIGIATLIPCAGWIAHSEQRLLTFLER
jgi:hypothetical protein